MKLKLTIFSFFSILLIVASIYHLSNLDNHYQTNAKLRSGLLDSESINDTLYQEYADKENQHRYLKNIAAKKIYEERKMAEENNKHAVAMSNVIPIQYQRLLKDRTTNEPISLNTHKNILNVLIQEKLENKSQNGYSKEYLSKCNIKPNISQNINVIRDSYTNNYPYGGSGGSGNTGGIGSSNS